MTKPANKPASNKPASNKPAPTLAQQASAAASSAAQQPASISAIGANTQVSIIGAKQYIRQLLSVEGAALSVAELCAASGKTAVNVRTMLSDLRSPKYAGKAGVFLTVSVRGADGVTRYSKAPTIDAK